MKMIEPEKKPVKAELVESDKKSKSNLGKYLITGGPGRPKNALSKFTMMKKDLVDVWNKGKGKQRLLEMLKSRDIADYKWAVERIIQILPKETIIDIDATVGPKVVIVVQENKEKEVIE